jgi:hypothetical protein
MGFDFRYEGWRGKLLKAWEIFVAICLLIGIVTGFHNIFTNIAQVSIFTESFQTAANWTMCIVRIIVLNIYREKFEELIYDLRKASKIGKSIPFLTDFCCQL